jgi:hypothetical protein
MEQGYSQGGMMSTEPHIQIGSSLGSLLAGEDPARESGDNTERMHPPTDRDEQDLVDSNSDATDGDE